jgi:hypothetical protein
LIRGDERFILNNPGNLSIFDNNVGGTVKMTRINYSAAVYSDLHAISPASFQSFRLK